MLKRVNMSLPEYRRFCEESIRPLLGDHQALERWKDAEQAALNGEYAKLFGLMLLAVAGLIGVLWVVLSLVGAG